MTPIRNTLAALLTFFLAVPVGVLTMACVLLLTIAFVVLALPAFAGLFVLERAGVPGARELRESLSETLSDGYGDIP